MNQRVSIAGLVPLLAVAMTLAACSHNKSKEQAGEQQQAGQSKQGQQAQSGASKEQQMSQAQQQQQQPSMLGEQNVSEGSAQIQRQKKVVSTIIVKEKIPTVKEQTIRADINRMNAKQFTALGFPTDVSHNIIQYRDQNGPFHNVDDLANVNGVTRSMLKKFDGALGVDQSLAGISGQGMSSQQQSGQQSKSDQQSQSGQQSQAGQQSQSGQQSDSSSSWNQ